MVFAGLKVANIAKIAKRGNLEKRDYIGLFRAKIVKVAKCAGHIPYGNFGNLDFTLPRRIKQPAATGFNHAAADRASLGNTKKPTFLVD